MGQPSKPLTPGGKHRTKWGWDYQVPAPKEGLVPDRETAIKIAEVVLFRLYGEESIVHQRPYNVKETKKNWWISGTLKDGHFGSVFNIAISKQTGAVIHLEQ
jgi:NTF2 fold immunity protein of polymorphic toxin system component